MKSTLTKLIATLTLTSLLSTSVFANDSLNRIIADAQDGAEVVTQLTDALSSGEISPNDLNLYLKDNTSPRSYKEISEAMKTGDASKIGEAIAKSEGANFAASGCLVGNSLLAITGIVSLVVMLDQGAIAQRHDDAIHNQIREGNLNASLVVEQMRKDDAEKLSNFAGYFMFGSIIGAVGLNMTACR